MDFDSMTSEQLIKWIKLNNGTELIDDDIDSLNYMDKTELLELCIDLYNFLLKSDYKDLTPEQENLIIEQARDK